MPNPTFIKRGSINLLELIFHAMNDHSALLVRPRHHPHLSFLYVVAVPDSEHFRGLFQLQGREYLHTLVLVETGGGKEVCVRDVAHTPDHQVYTKKKINTLG